MTETTDERRHAKEAEHRALVAEIDNIRNADGAPAPTFAERAENGSITWAKAATEARQWKRERSEALDRLKRGIQQVNTYWCSVEAVQGTPHDPYVKDVLADLYDVDRRKLATILGQLKPDLNSFQGLVPDTDDPARALAAAALERVIQAKKPDHVLYALLAALCGALSHGDT